MAESVCSQHMVVIGCGTRVRGDDSVGLVIARALRPRLPPYVRVIAHSGDGAVLMGTWQGAQALVLVDAAEGAGEPGSIVCLDAAAGQLPVNLRASSTHSFGIGEAIELARALGELPRAVVIYAIVGRCYAPGIGLSPEVKAAARLVIRSIAASVCDMDMHLERV